MRPLYARIEEGLRSRIAAQQLVSGDRLPSENELAQQFATTRATVRQAMARLEFEGLIARRPGLGTFVASPTRIDARLDTGRLESFEEQMEAGGHRAVFRLIADESIPCERPVSDALDVPVGESVRRIERLRLVDGLLVGIEERFVREPFASEIPAAALERLSAVTFMANTSAAPIGELRVEVRAENAGGDLPAKLELEPGAAVLVREHRFLGRGRQPVLYGTATYRGDRYQFSYLLDGRGYASSPTGSR